MANAGHRFGDIEAVGLPQIKVRTKAQFEHQQGMIQQAGGLLLHGEEAIDMQPSEEVMSLNGHLSPTPVEAGTPA